MLFQESKENKYLIFDRTHKLSKKGLIKEILYYPYSAFQEIKTLISGPKFLKKKYYCSICAIFRDEAIYLKEWIEYHRIIGIDHFYLYNNFSVDNYLEILSPYINEGIVTLIDWEFERAQMKAYQDCFDKYKNDTNWIAFIDLDEFIVPNHYSLICDMLKQYEKYPALLVYWRYFGSSGIMKRDVNRLVTDDFYIAWRKYADIGKMIFNTSYNYINDDAHNSNMHLMWGEYEGSFFAPVNPFFKRVIFNINKVHTSDMPIQINHYAIKSYSEYVEKKSKRGGGVHDVSMHSMDYFYYHESFCGEADYHIKKYTTRLKKNMNCE